MRFLHFKMLKARIVTLTVQILMRKHLKRQFHAETSCSYKIAKLYATVNKTVQFFITM